MNIKNHLIVAICTRQSFPVHENEPEVDFLLFFYTMRKNWPSIRNFYKEHTNIIKKRDSKFLFGCTENAANGDES